VELLDRLRSRPLDLWSIAVEEPAGSPLARLAARSLAHTQEGVCFDVVERDSEGQELASIGVSLPLVGRYNVSNVLCALASARALGIGLAQAVAACESLTPVPGRMEQVTQAAAGQPLVLVDYAHTPDALEKALQALQPVTQERSGALWVVVGCGGDRDASKRPLMAAVAEREAAHVVLTSDNPRTEVPAGILEQMAAGLQRRDHAVIEVDRALAIAETVRNAPANDVILIAGKGHEDYQDVQGVKSPFSDLAHARSALAQRYQIAGGQA
jgi:UDP-N-acetylmuramoyl-L-alanyl-D-glutamate--2,6-diaminopimelate ligase